MGAEGEPGQLSDGFKEFRNQQEGAEERTSVQEAEDEGLSEEGTELGVAGNRDPVSHHGVGVILFPVLLEWPYPNDRMEFGEKFMISYFNGQKPQNHGF